MFQSSAPRIKLCQEIITWGVNSGPHAHAASNLQIEKSLQSPSPMSKMSKITKSGYYMDYCSDS